MAISPIKRALFWTFRMEKAPLLLYELAKKFPLDVSFDNHMVRFSHRCIREFEYPECNRGGVYFKKFRRIFRRKERTNWIDI